MDSAQRLHHSNFGIELNGAYRFLVKCELKVFDERHQAHSCLKDAKSNAHAISRTFPKILFANIESTFEIIAKLNLPKRQEGHRIPFFHLLGGESIRIKLFFGKNIYQ